MTPVAASWIVGAVILALLVFLHWWAYRVAERRRLRRRERRTGQTWNSATFR